MNEPDKELLMTRVTQETHLDPNAMHIFYTNAEVASHNDAMLEKIDTETIVLKANIKGPTKGYTAPKTVDGRIGNTRFFEKLRIKIGARCVLTWNISTADGLVNGSCGTIIAFERGSKLTKESKDAIVVKFDDDRVGIHQRQRHQRLSKKFENENGTPIFRQEIDYNIRSKKGFAHAATAKIDQFPIAINYACTAHRMQVRYNDRNVIVNLSLQNYFIGPNCHSWNQGYTSLASKSNSIAKRLESKQNIFPIELE